MTVAAVLYQPDPASGPRHSFCYLLGKLADFLSECLLELGTAKGAACFQRLENAGFLKAWPPSSKPGQLRRAIKFHSASTRSIRRMSSFQNSQSWSYTIGTKSSPRKHTVQMVHWLCPDGEGQAEVSEAAILTLSSQKRMRKENHTPGEMAKTEVTWRPKGYRAWCFTVYVNLAGLQGLCAWSNFSPDVTVKASF